MITIKEVIDVPSPRDRVWEVVSSPSDVVSCIAGAELGAAHDDGSFDGALVIKFGAIRVRFAARITLDLNPEEFEGRLSARGGDGQGATRFRGEATFRVVEGEQAGSARVLMEGEVTLSGKLASLVESGAGVVVSRMTKDFTAKLIAVCGEPAAAAAGVPAAEGVPAAAGAPGTAPVPAAAGGEAHPTRLNRLRAWFGRLLRRRRAAHPAAQPPPSPPRPSGDGALHPQQTQQTQQTEEVGSGNAPAQ
ncbi:Carbon monoxide dehydrogenase subunit G [Actinacidiphila yanglinensis]|uniref:Carbon monoxide dehydrogenase subunit G n=1 Tax=Actinacidiphila yanglinensis TaxID=310779 RepID=A0A1H6EGY7_9ACTN|nr:SRPBCC domain-containing protein [Actinacidiphila yanglinensis]SEG96065.1 Carbon monoxide dehydrogenase subunit G [Actinacidiphila yanglinensis]